MAARERSKDSDIVRNSNKDGKDSDIVSTENNTISNSRANDMTTPSEEGKKGKFRKSN